MVKTKGFVGLALTPLIKLKIAKATGELAQELKPYMEHGKAQQRNTTA